MHLSCSVLTTPEELLALRPAWSDLLARSSSDELMLSPTWLLTWWRVFGGIDGRALRVAAIRGGDRLIGLAPLLARAHRYPPGVPFRRLELLGTGEREEDEINSEYLGVIAERGAEQDVARALVDALAEEALGPWDELVLRELDAGAAIAPLLAAELGARGFGGDLEVTGASLHVDLPATYDDYLAALTAPGRYLVRRSMRDFERWARGDARVRVATSPEELEVGRRALIALHTERWGGGGVFTSARFNAFHDAVMPALLDEQRRTGEAGLELSWIEVRGEPVAAVYNVRFRDRMYFYQSGRRLDLPRAIRPGIVMQARSIERAIELGLRRYDFLGGTARYKRQLALGTRAIGRIRAVRAPAGLRERGRRFAAQGLASARAFGRAALGARPRPARDTAPAAVLCGDLNMLRCFAGSDVRAVVVSPNPTEPAFFSRHCGERRMMADPRRDPAGAVRDLLAIGRLHDEPPALFCGDDATLLAVSRGRAELGACFRFLLPDAELVEALLDKTRFAELARRLDLPVPRTRAGIFAESADDVAREVPPPCIVKPHTRVGWTGSAAVAGLGEPPKALRANSPAELARALDRVARFSPSFVVQAYIPGGEDEVYSFHAYLDAERRPLGTYVGRKIRTYPRSAGASTFLELVDEPELARIGLDVVERLGLVGPAKLDFKRDPRTGRFYLLEVNPRFSLWNHLGAASGVNLPMLAYRDLAGLAPEPAAALRPGIRWLALGDDARAFLRDYRPAGELSWAGWLRSLRGPMVHDVFAWDDASPLVVSLVNALRGRAQRGRLGA